MENYLLLLAAVILLAVDFIIRKRYQVIAGTSMAAGFYYNMLLGATATVIFFAANAFRWESTPFSLLMAALQAGLAILYTIIGFRIMRESVALFTLFLMTGGMVIPYLWGLAFLSETFTVLRLIGLVVIIVAVFLARGGAKRVSPTVAVLCVIVFILNGFVSVISKVHQVSEKPIVTSMGFTILVNFFKLVFSGAAYGVIKAVRKEKVKGAPLKKTLPLVVATTAVSGTSYVLQLNAAVKVNASVMYPMLTGGTIIFTSLMAWLCYREKPSRREALGIALCFIGTLMFL